MGCSEGWQDLGKARQVAIGGNGSVWAIGTHKGKDSEFDYEVLHYEPTSENEGIWNVDPTMVGVRIAVTPNGTPWVLDAIGHVFERPSGKWQPRPTRLYERTESPKNPWQPLFDQLTDLVIGPEGSLFGRGREPREQGTSIYRYSAESDVWYRLPSASATSLAVGLTGVLWTIGTSGAIRQLQEGRLDNMGLVGTAIGGVNRSPTWMLSNNSTSGGYRVRKKNGARWEELAAGGIELAVAPDDRAWIVTNDRRVCRSPSSFSSCENGSWSAKRKDPLPPCFLDKGILAFPYGPRNKQLAVVFPTLAGTGVVWTLDISPEQLGCSPTQHQSFHNLQNEMANLEGYLGRTMYPLATGEAHQGPAVCQPTATCAAMAAVDLKLQCPAEWTLGQKLQALGKAAALQTFGAQGVLRLVEVSDEASSDPCKNHRGSGVDLYRRNLGHIIEPTYNMDHIDELQLDGTDNERNLSFLDESVNHWFGVNISMSLESLRLRGCYGVTIKSLTFDCAVKSSR